ncbi:MAG: zf-HC2 domain-containing protein [Pirellulales bacterium]|nr:zf-HC2 domain-containing protein [Pirellulales bacterium]
MTASESSQPTQEIREHLVAYLDGELDAETSRRVDDLLSTDPVVRKDVADLDATWNLLEHMPRAELGEKFTRTTLELVAQQAEEELEQLGTTRPKLNIALAATLIVGMFTAGLLGVLGADLISPNDNEVLLENLPVIQQLDQLEQIGDYEFLHELHKREIFEAEIEDEPPDPDEAGEVETGEQGGQPQSAQNEVQRERP